MHAGRLSVVALSGLALMATGSPAWADGTADAWNQQDRIGAEATSPGGTNDAVTKRPKTGSRRAGPAPACKYEVLPPEEQENSAQLAESGWGAGPKEGDTRPGRWLRKICGQDATSPGTATVIWVPQRTDPQVLAEKAVREADLPTPAVVTNPSVDQPLLVNLPTWLALDPAAWAPVDVSASAGGVTVTAVAVPERVVWDLGNSEQLTCDGPGSVYDRSRPAAGQAPMCSYTYRQPGQYRITATVEWRVTWQAVGVPGGGDLGVARRSNTVPVRVTEVQTVNQTPRQGG